MNQRMKGGNVVLLLLSTESRGAEVRNRPDDLDNTLSLYFCCQVCYCIAIRSHDLHKLCSPILVHLSLLMTIISSSPDLSFSGEAVFVYALCFAQMRCSEV